MAQQTTSVSSVSERTALGRQARSQVPRSSHAQFEPAPDRPDPIAILEEQAASRVPELVPIRYGRMLSSPFAFFRGAAAIMAGDLSKTPRSGITAQLCGDAHLSNFGVFASPERRLIFDVNDFDETHRGPWEWDVKRLAASVSILGRERQMTPKQCADAAKSVAEAYRLEMQTLAGLPELDVWYRHFDADKLMKDLAPQMAPTLAERTKSGLAKARTQDSLRAADKMSVVQDGGRRFISNPPLVVPIRELLPGPEGENLAEALNGLLRSYRRTLQSDRKYLLDRFRAVDLARKVVGVGSVGTRCWIVLLLGRDESDPLILQAKEAQRSVLEPYTGPSPYRNNGQRVVAGQHLMQATSDIFLGWDRMEEPDGIQADSYVRQLRDWKGSVNPDRLDATSLVVYARACAWTLARAHARSGDRIAVSAYLGTSDVFDKAVAEFAGLYADQNQKDYAALQSAVAAGRVTAQTGV